jgi:hypothetical protein
LLVFFAILLRLFFDDKESLLIDDSDDFKRALYEWTPLIHRYFQSPRALKRYLNKVRFLASRQRGMSDTDGVQRIDRLAEKLAQLWERMWDRDSYDDVGWNPTANLAVVKSATIPDRVLVVLVALECDPQTWKILYEKRRSLVMPEDFFDLMDSGTRGWWTSVGREFPMGAIREMWRDLTSHFDRYCELAGSATPVESQEFSKEPQARPDSKTDSESTDAPSEVIVTR